MFLLQHLIRSGPRAPKLTPAAPGRLQQLSKGSGEGVDGVAASVYLILAPPPAQEPQCKDACARIDDGWGQDLGVGGYDPVLPVLLLGL